MTSWQNLEIPYLEGFTGFVPPSGTGSSGVCITGEAPGEMEARYGVPFYEKAPAGSCLNRLLRRAGLDRESFVLTNAVWSRPPGNYLDGSRWEGEAIAGYRPFRDKMFEVYRPRVFLALGGVALRTLSAYGGKGASITNVQGYVLDGPYDGTWCIGALHPSAIMRGEQRMSGVVIWALQRAIDIARNGFCRTPTRYITHPCLDDALAFERAYSPEQRFLSYDIETIDSMGDEEEVEDKIDEISFQITRISFCYDGPNAHAISFPWQRPYTDIARRLLSSHGPKRAWNGYGFDNPRLEAADVPIGGRLYDVMWGFKQLQPTLPRNLGFVAPFYNYTGEPWKHLSQAEPERYSCIDAHTLQLIGDGVDDHLRQKGQWEVYERHTVDLDVVLRKMSRNGLPYDTVKARAFEDELQVKWDERKAALQTVVPAELKRPKQKSGYKKPPVDIEGLEIRSFSVLGNDLTKTEIGDLADRGIIPQDFEIYVVKRWCKLEPFNPGSPGEAGQVADLIRHYGHTIGKNRKTKKGTVDDDHLKKLQKKCRSSKKPRDKEFADLLQIVRECRQLSKVLGTYVKGWRPGSDGRIHATPGHWGKMFRVSWRRPNISATIQDKTEEAIAKGFRKCVAVSAGRVLVECDWKGIEAVLVGWFAADPDYMRLARIGVHDYMGIYMAGGTVDLSLPDGELRRIFKEFKRAEPKLRDDAKHTVHGTNYGMGPRLMADLYEMTEANAKRLQGLYFELFPKIQAWQRATLDRASKECKLRNPFGYEMPFWEVFRWDSKYQRWALGEDAKSAIAFLPRDTAAAMLKEVLLRPTIQQLADDHILLCSTHDSLTAECSIDEMQQVAMIMKTEMELPVPQLDGLSVGVEAKAGSAWHESEMHTLELEAVAV